MKKKEKRTQTITQTVDIVYCDYCGKEIPKDRRNGVDIDSSITIRSLAVFYLEYGQGEWRYDCCLQCCKKIKNMFDKEKE